MANTNLGAEINVLSNNSQYIPVYPATTQSQVLDWNIGEVFGPYSLVLYANAWTENVQPVTLNGVTSNDIVTCIKVLNGTQEEMQAQDEAYSLIDPNIGIQSFNNEIEFTCTNQSPTVDLQVQVWWTR